MASPMQWTWTWANFGRQWGTGRPGMLQSMGSQRNEHNWATEQQQYSLYINFSECPLWQYDKTYSQQLKSGELFMYWKDNNLQKWKYVTQRGRGEGREKSKYITGIQPHNISLVIPFNSRVRKDTYKLIDSLDPAKPAVLKGRGICKFE